jgi:hypothetical protein
MGYIAVLTQYPAFMRFPNITFTTVDRTNLQKSATYMCNYMSQDLILTCLGQMLKPESTTSEMANIYI